MREAVAANGRGSADVWIELPAQPSPPLDNRGSKFAG